MLVASVTEVIFFLLIIPSPRFPLSFSPQPAYNKEYDFWHNPNFIDQLMFDHGEWGANWHPDLVPVHSTILCAPHKNLSGFQTSDINIQLRKRGIKPILLAGMLANLCVESHLRDAEENGYEVIVVNDAAAVNNF